MSKVYFNISDLFNDSDVDTGCTFSFYLKTIKVGGVEQLTADYFSEVPQFSYVNPHTSNAWEFSNCSQSGVYPNLTSINVCALGGAPNSWNPFADALKVNYSDVVNGVKRGQITTSVSGSNYGLEQFNFGFDKIDVPINDASPSNGSSGSSINGAFYLDIDTTLDFDMDIEITKKDSSGALVHNATHQYRHSSVDCSFTYNVVDDGSYFLASSVGGVAGLPLVPTTYTLTLEGSISGIATSTLSYPLPSIGVLQLEMAADIGILNFGSIPFVSACSQGVPFSYFAINSGSGCGGSLQYIHERVNVITQDNLTLSILSRGWEPINEDVKQIGFLSGGDSGWIIPICSGESEGCDPIITKAHKFTTGTGFQQKIVSAGNGFSYAIPYTAGQVLKIDESDLSFVAIGPVLGADAIYHDGKLAPNLKIYCPPAGTNGDMLVIDTATNLVTLLNVVTSPSDEQWYCGDINSLGIMYCPAGNIGSANPWSWIKVDTNSNTVSLIHSTTGTAPNYRSVKMGSNDKMYCFSGTPNVPVLEYDTSLESQTSIGTTTTTFSFADTSYEHSNGNIYSMGSIDVSGNPKMLKIDISTGLMSEIDLNLLGNQLYSGINLGSDGNLWLIPFTSLNPSSFKLFDEVAESILGTQEVFVSAQPALLISSAIDSNGNLICISASTPPSGDDGSLITLEFENCEGEGGLAACDSIVTQAIGLLSKQKREKIILFTTDKDCCYHSLVVADLNDDVDYKNDINGFLVTRDFSSETIEFVLLKNGGAAEGGTDIPMVNNDYGTFYNFNYFVDYPNYKGYQVDWRKVLNLEGEGDYQIQVTSTLVTGVDVDKSIPFQLRTYSEERVLGTVRIQSIMNGYLRNPDFNYKGLNWLDGIRFCGMFGNRQPEYEEERIIYSNREVKQLRSELINKYNMKSMHLPSCITDIVLEYHNLSNKMLITDYNDINHKVYVQTEVILDSVNTIEYPVVANKAPLDIIYKDYVQNYNKSNC